MGMFQGWRDLDRILRGEATRLPALRRGRVEAAVGGLVLVLAILAMVYGVCMGSYAAFRGSPSAGMQALASLVKVPALYGLTLVVTFPSLYVFNALVGSRLSVGSLLRLLIAALGVTIAVLASLGPIVAFFGASTTSYPFMKLLNVIVFGAAGFLGMAFLLQTLHRLSLVAPELEKPPAEGGSAEPEAGGLVLLEEVAPERVPVVAGPGPRPTPGVLDRPDDRVLSRHVKAVFRCWIVLFGLVGAQMGWVLRPFIGDPSLPFAWFRGRESNIFIAILHTLGSLLSG